MAKVESGIGPMVAVSVVTLCLRLSFTLFTNFSMTVVMLTGGKLPPLTNLLLVYPRTVLKSIVLAGLAHSGQRFKNEVI